MLFVFFFQAEDGIRDGTVTGVQTCALPILESESSRRNIRIVDFAQCSWLTPSRIDAVKPVAIPYSFGIRHVHAHVPEGQAVCRPGGMRIWLAGAMSLPSTSTSSRRMVTGNTGQPLPCDLQFWQITTQSKRR